MGRAHHRRFLIPPEALGNGQVTFSPAQARQLVVVLRLHDGDLVSVFDGTGREWTVQLAHATRRHVVGRVLDELPPRAPSTLRLALAQIVPRGAAMDRIVGKATELGVSRIIPLEASCSVRRASLSGHVARWRRIIVEAAEQCGRRCLPDLREPYALEDFLRGHPPDQPLLACHAGDGAVPLVLACQTLGLTAGLTVLVGGEGGLSAEEVNRVRAAGGRLVALGPSLLRADTAALAALVILQACLGDWARATGMSRKGNGHP